jgi:endonuclease YncB( thermonuclease family)
MKTVALTLFALWVGYFAAMGEALGQRQKPSVVYDVVITRVIDGDTVAFQAPFLPDPLKKELSVRIFGVDTPEKGHRASCPSEAQRGAAATEAVAVEETLDVIGVISATASLKGTEN